MVYDGPDVGQTPVHMVVSVMVVMAMAVSILLIMLMVVVMYMLLRIMMTAMFMFVAVVVLIVMMVMVVMPVIMRMGVFMIMAVRVTVDIETLLFLPLDPDRQMGTPDAAFIHGLCLIGHARDTQGVQAVDHAGGVRVKLQKSGGKHVSGSPHIAGKIQCFHRFFSPLVQVNGLRPPCSWRTLAKVMHMLMQAWHMHDFGSLFIPGG